MRTLKTSLILWQVSLLIRYFIWTMYCFWYFLAGDFKLTPSSATLVICPTSLIFEWEREVRSKVRPGYVTCLLYHGSKRINFSVSKWVFFISSSFRCFGLIFTFLNTYCIVYTYVKIQTGVPRHRHHILRHDIQWSRRRRRGRQKEGALYIYHAFFIQNLFLSFQVQEAQQSRVALAENRLAAHNPGRGAHDQEPRLADQQVLLPAARHEPLGPDRHAHPQQTDRSLPALEVKPGFLTSLYLFGSVSWRFMRFAPFSEWEVWKRWISNDKTNISGA